MGHIAHDAVIAVFSDDDPFLNEIETFVSSLPDRFQWLIVGPIPSVANGYTTYVFAPDGSKEEGYEHSDTGDECRQQFIDLVRSRSSAEWVHVRFGSEGVDIRGNHLLDGDTVEVPVN